MNPGTGRQREFAARVKLHGDASSRRYYRLVDTTGDSAIEARYPVAERQMLLRDLEVHQWLHRNGLRVPRLLEIDPDQDRVVLEDFGALDAEATLAARSGEDRLTAALTLVRPLAVLAGLPVVHLPAWNAPLDRDRLRWELAGFELWFVRYLTDQPVNKRLGRWLDELAASVAAHPCRICHRDYHLNNIFLLDNDEVGVIDAQDLLVGPDTYDAASLLYERSFPDLFTEGETTQWLEHWAGATSARDGWLGRVAETRTQRGLKVLGTFARLVQSGRPGYGRWMKPLARSLAPVVDGLGAPPRLATLLLDWSRQGGSDVWDFRTP